MYVCFIIYLAIAIIMHVISTRENLQVHRETGGVVRSQLDLNKVKAAINLSMRFAMVYIILFITFVAVLIVAWRGGEPFMRGVFVMLVFGVVTLPLGLVGKHFEKKIRGMSVKADDPLIEQKFREYLKMWDQPRFQLPE